MGAKVITRGSIARLAGVFTGLLEYTGIMKHGRQSVIKTIVGTTALIAADSGKLIQCATDTGTPDAVVTLPSTILGLSYKLQILLPTASGSFVRR